MVERGQINFTSRFSKGLKEANLVGAVHKCLYNRTYCCCLAQSSMLPLVSEVEPTPLRTACARIPLHAVINVDTGQGVPESLSLQLKVCQRTHGARMKRHDRISQKTSKTLAKIGYKAIVKPRFLTSVGYRIPQNICKLYITTSQS